MNDDNASAKAEGEALPENGPAIVKSLIRGETKKLETDAERVFAAVERWYERHFHRCAVAGVAPLSADDKAELHKHLAEAVAPAATEE
ncbi:MAG: hypothetical protein ACTHMK_13695 [Dyella sp.]|uniref:hypothetical protein n=1 Tax=Dyella sp. TaxID=1869338 RepID=UPI003F7F3091